MNKIKGVLAFLTVTVGVAAALFFSGGCAHSHVKTFYPTGKKQCDLVTTVLGQGEVAVLIESDTCPDSIYESENTGLSDNGVEALERAVEAGVKAALPIPVP